MVDFGSRALKMRWGGGVMLKGARSTPTCSPPPPHSHMLTGAEFMEQNWNFFNISMNFKKLKEAVRAPDVLFQEEKKEVLTRR